MGAEYIEAIGRIVAIWLVAAVLAALGAWLAAHENRGLFATLAAVAVAICGGMTVALPGVRATQFDTLHFREATILCKNPPVRVLKRVSDAEIKIGIYEGYLVPYDGRLGPSTVKDVDQLVRSRGTAPKSAVGSLKVVGLKHGDVPPPDVYPLFRHIQQGSVNVSVIDPASGEILAYSNYLIFERPETRTRYVNCNRESLDSPRELEADELVGLMAALVPRAQTAAPAVRKRRYDIEPDTTHEVRDDCSRGLRLAPGQSRSDYRYHRSGEDLVVLVLDRASWNTALARKSELAAVNQSPILWQHFYPVITCKGYLTDDRKAGPVFHASGYEEPVASVRANAQTPFRPFDYGPHRVVNCTDTIAMGSVRPTAHYVLKRDGTDLVVAALEDQDLTPLKVTPLITCKGYFGADPGATPDVRLGTSDARETAFREVVYSASRVLDLSDGEYLGQRSGSYITKRLKDKRGVAAQGPAPTPPPWDEKRRGSGNPWPATPGS